MSGGHLGYFYATLEEHVGDFGDKELDDLVKDLAELFHDREWYLSADTGVGNWNEARDEFKEKWFSEYGREQRVEKYLNQISNEVREMLGINPKRCHKCKHWKSKDGYEGRYGECDTERGMRVLMHRNENCDLFSELEY